MRRSIIPLALVVACATAPAAAQTTVGVDFGQFADPPLIKTKFGVYQTPLAPIDRLLRDLPLLGELEARFLRFETAWGKSVDFNAPSISGTPSNLVYDRTDYTRWVDGVVAQGARPLLTHGYTPEPLVPAGADWRSPPSDLAAWGRVNEETARYWYERGLKGLDIEIWNEPDLASVFFTGTKEDYFEIYKYGSRGVRAVHPDAKIGGPVTAFTEWYSSFLPFVRRENLPLDFLSGHAYATPDTQIESMRNVLGRNSWPGVEMWLTEYAAYPSNPGVDIRGGGAIERYRAAADFLHDAKRFLASPELTTVYWAQWSDIEFRDDQANWTVRYDADKMGFVDVTGQKKAIYNAFALYNEMPVERNAVQVAGSGIDALASSDAHTAALLVWSDTDAAGTASVSLTNLPFQRGMADLYRIDADHASLFENRSSPELRVVESRPFDGGQFSWSGAVPGHGTLFLKLTDGTGIASLAANPVAQVVRTDHWFADRGNTHYAEFDPHTWTAHLGMGSAKDQALAQVGITAEALPAQLRVRIATTGSPRDVSVSSLLGVRIDFGDGAGGYTKSVLFHGSLYHAERTATFPWGTTRQPDEVVQVEDIADFGVDLAAYAPTGIPDRAVISFVMQDTGRDSRATIRVTRGGSETPAEPGVGGSARTSELGQNYPNPLRETTTVPYGITELEHVRIEVYDPLGRLVDTLVDGVQAAGSHTVDLDARSLSSGIYVYHMQAGPFSDTKQLVILR